MYKTSIVRDNLNIQLALQVTEELLPQATERAAHLIALTGSIELSERAASYLDRATRLYLWGFDPECVVMCRSVLEAALAARLDELLILDQPTPNLDSLIGLAGKNGILQGYRKAKNKKGWRADRDTPLWSAERIRLAGNSVVHDVPALEVGQAAIPDTRTAIVELAGVLKLLFG